MAPARRADPSAGSRAAAAAAAAPQAPAAAAPAGDDVTDTVVGIVSELTGYPPDLLDVDLDLEADLGVDTVKQAEIFAAHPRALRRRPRRQPSSCATFPP